MRYALIGCGRISPNHFEAAKNNGLDIVAISDIVEDRMHEKKENLKLSDDVKFFINYKQLLEQTTPDLVAICTEWKTCSDCS